MPYGVTAITLMPDQELAKKYWLVWYKTNTLNSTSRAASGKPHRARVDAFTCLVYTISFTATSISEIHKTMELVQGA